MPREFTLNPSRTYATAANARKAVERYTEGKLNFMIVGHGDRFAPVFFGPNAVAMVGALIHSGFTVVG